MNESVVVLGMQFARAPDDHDIKLDILCIAFEIRKFGHV